MIVGDTIELLPGNPGYVAQRVVQPGITLFVHDVACHDIHGGRDIERIQPPIGPGFDRRRRVAAVVSICGDMNGRELLRGLILCRCCFRRTRAATLREHPGGVHHRPEDSREG